MNNWTILSGQGGKENQYWNGCVNVDRSQPLYTLIYFETFPLIKVSKTERQQRLHRSPIPSILYFPNTEQKSVCPYRSLAAGPLMCPDKFSSFFFYLLKVAGNWPRTLFNTPPWHQQCRGREIQVRNSSVHVQQLTAAVLLCWQFIDSRSPQPRPRPLCPRRRLTCNKGGDSVDSLFKYNSALALFKDEWIEVV